MSFSGVCGAGWEEDSLAGYHDNEAELRLKDNAKRSGWNSAYPASLFRPFLPTTLNPKP